MGRTVADNRRVPPAFRYFELVDDTTDRYEFWEIAVDGPTLELRHGPVGTAGKHERETFASEAIALSEHQLRIAAHLADGFREVADRRLDARTRALEDAIAADPDDATSFLVYADWIQTLGDARGSLIVAQHAAESDPAAAKRAAAYLKHHEELFLGPLAKHLGFEGAYLELTWHRGFIRRAIMYVDHHAECARVFEALLDHPSARWLSELTLQTFGPTTGMQAVVDVLARHVCPHLRSLEIGEVGQRREADLDDETNLDTWWARPGANLQQLWPAVPALRRLVIRGEPQRIGVLALPQLEHLELHVRDLSPSDLHSIVRTTGPLERLELRFLWPLGGELADDLRPLFESSLIRGLDHLAIAGERAWLTGVDGVCEAIARLPKLSLRSLDLSQGWMTDRGAEALANSRLELDLIDVSRNQLTYQGKAMLERIAKLVIS